MRKLLPAVLAATWFMTLLGRTAAAGPETPSARNKLQREAVVNARAGKFDSALSQLRKLLNTSGNANGVMWDYISVLSWAGKHSEAVIHYEEVPDQTTVPDRVIRDVAKSYRDLRQYPQALKLYDTLLRKKADDEDALRGTVLTLVDAELQDEAMARLGEFRSQFPHDIELDHVVAALYWKQRDYLRAMQIYDWILQREPVHAQTVNLKAGVMSDMGAVMEALSYAETNAAVITPETRLTLDCNLAAAHFAWGEPDEALTLLDRVIAAETRPMSHLRARFDRIISLHAMKQMPMVVEEYTNLMDNDVEIPPWINSLAASAYLYLEEPKRAEELYQAAVKAQPDYFDAWFGLYDVNVELGNYKDAEKVLAHLRTITPEWPTRRGNFRYNWDRQSIELAQASCLAYQNRLVEAQAAWDLLLARAPANLGARTGRAYVEAWRGWHRQALGSFDCVITISSVDPLPRPDYVPSRELSARNGRTEVMNELFLRNEAREYGRSLLERNPSNLHTRRVNRRMEIQDSTEFFLDSLYTKEDEGATETMLQLRLTQPIKPLLSVYGAYLYRRSTDSIENTPAAEIHRAFVGTIWTFVPSMTLTAEVSDDLRDTGNEGFMANLQWRLNDYWSADAGHNTYSLDVPLRARAEGITGKKTEGSVAYRHSERATVRVASQLQQLDDDNDHLWVGVFGEHSLYTRAHLQTRLLAEVSGSENSRTDVSYFSPDHDLAVLLTHQLDHTFFRRYDRLWMHRLFLSIGAYDQAGYDAKPIWGVRYEHDYNFADDCALLWGLGYSRRSYDGDPTDVIAIYLTFRKTF